MKATLTRDLLTGNAVIRIKTCSEAINYMGEIFGFVKDNNIPVKMNTDFYRVSFTIRIWEDCEHWTPKIMQFIEDIQNGTIKGN